MQAWMFYCFVWQIIDLKRLTQSVSVQEFEPDLKQAGLIMTLLQVMLNAIQSGRWSWEKQNNWFQSFLADRIFE